MRETTRHVIDLRSDTVTLPSPDMFAAAAEAPLADDIHDGDPTTGRLERMVADRLGKEAGLFVASGTQSNLTALLTHCGRGEEYITGKSYHIYASEAGGGAVLGGISPCPLDVAEDGSLDPADVVDAIKPDNFHYPVTRLVALENTLSGRIVPQDRIDAATAVAREHGLGTHLDGARLFNAAVALNEDPARLARGFDSVSLCLSKGLGAPAGSVLCGDGDFIDRARRVRKLLGGAMRQSGVLAAFGIAALEHNIERLAEDHANARKLAAGLAAIPGLEVETEAVDTNMVFIRPPVAEIDNLIAHLRGGGIVISSRTPRIRLVTHRDISAADIDTVVDRFIAFFEGGERARASG